METTALSVKDAESFLKAHERHYKEPIEAICAIGLSENGILHGAALLGRMDNETAQLAHVYCDGAWQGYSLLYGASWRALKALGYKNVIL